MFSNPFSRKEQIRPGDLLFWQDPNSKSPSIPDVVEAIYFNGEAVEQIPARELEEPTGHLLIEGRMSEEIHGVDFWSNDQRGVPEVDPETQALLDKIRGQTAELQQQRKNDPQKAPQLEP